MTLALADLALMLRGLGMTALLTGLGTIAALALAVPLALALRNGSLWLRAPARFYVEIMRGTPLVLLLFLLYYGGPAIGIRLRHRRRALWGLPCSGPAPSPKSFERA